MRLVAFVTNRRTRRSPSGRIAVGNLRGLLADTSPSKAGRRRLVVRSCVTWLKRPILRRIGG